MPSDDLHAPAGKEPTGCPIHPVSLGFARFVFLDITSPVPPWWLWGGI